MSRYRPGLVACARVLALLALAPCAAAADFDPCRSIFQSAFNDGEVAPPVGLCDAERLNDTGITLCGEAVTGNNAQCSGSEPLGQDADSGRDALALAGQLAKAGAGSAGFDFTKVANDGTLLSVDAMLGPDAGQWACTRDNVTGLTWEVKIVDATHPRHSEQNYTWYFPDSVDGDAGDVGAPTYCRGSLAGQDCNTTNYVNAVNATGLCGANDWRLPTLQELVRLLDFGRESPALGTDYFPNTTEGFHWTSTVKAETFPMFAWYAYLGQGTTISYGSKGNSFRVLLVRSAP